MLKLVLALTLLLCFLYIHEYTHKTLFSYGGIQSKIGINWVGFYTTADIEWKDVPDELKMAQHMTDVVFYTLFLPFVLIVLLVLREM